MTKKQPKKSYGKTPSGREIAEEFIEEKVREAEEGYDVDEILERRRAVRRSVRGPPRWSRCASILNCVRRSMSGRRRKAGPIPR